MPVNVIIGLQRGDEGKGRFVDMMAEDHDIVARFNGGDNAGHTVVLPDGRDLALHLVPSGIAHPSTVNVIGNGTLVNPVNLCREITDIQSKDIEVSERNLRISSAAHLILPHHVCLDEIREAGTEQQGSTKSGIAQVSSFKSLRAGVRAEIINTDPEQLFRIVEAGLIAQREPRDTAGLEPIHERQVALDYISKAQRLGPFIADTVAYLNEQLRKDRPARVLAEGAQAFLLDIDHGMYPYTTSSSTTSGGVAPGLGIPPRFVQNVTGVAKAIQSHVGGGNFVTEIDDPELLTRLHGNMSTIDAEKGTTTGRIRRLGHFDVVQINRANMVNGTDAMALSKLDWVRRYGDYIKICVAYEYNGRRLQTPPDMANGSNQYTPVYQELPTWEEDITSIRQFEDLPKEARAYVEFIESQTKVPIIMIGVGPQRDQVIIR